MDSTVTGVAVLDKAVAILDALAEGPAGLAELVAATGIPRATCHRLAVALEGHGLLRRDDAGRFVLGVRVVALGQAAATTLPLGSASKVALERLRDLTGESVQLYVRDGSRRVCVQALESPHSLRTIVALGASLPLDRGSAGTVLREDPEALARGWAHSVAEREPGVASVSAPVLDASGRVRAAVSVSGPINRTTTDPGERYAPAVVAAAREVERAAGLR